MKKSFIISKALKIICIVVLFTSCVSQKEITYFQENKVGEVKSVVSQNFEANIQPGDILSIQVASLSIEANQFFAFQHESYSGGLKSTIPGYLVDTENNIEMPLIGKVRVGGMTTNEAKEIIRKQLERYLENPTISVRFENYRVSILGEVLKPGVLIVPNEKITLPEAIAMSGDLTIYANRKNILVIRETEGERKFEYLDLTSRNVFQSPYYYLQSNDIIYIEPGKGKLSVADNFYKIMPMLISTLTLISVIIVRF